MFILERSSSPPHNSKAMLVTVQDDRRTIRSTNRIDLGGMDAMGKLVTVNLVGLEAMM